MPAIFLPLALIAYLVGIFLAGIGTVYRSDAARGGGSAFFVLAWLAHTAALVRHGLAVGVVPPSNVAEYLLGLGWAVMSLHLLLWFGWRVHVAGLVLPPLAAVSGFMALMLLEHRAPLDGTRPSAWFLFHTTVSTLGMATLTVALAMSLVYLFQDRALKSRRTLKLLERLPSLESCDQIGFRSLVIGFIMLSVGIATGVIVNTMVHGKLLVFGVKQTLPLLAWGVFAGVLVARFKLGFRGRKSAWLTITGVTLGLLTVVGMTL